MDIKQLYHIEQDTLLTLYPKGFMLEVKQQFVQVYYLSQSDFMFLYLLATAHPKLVSYQEFLYVFENLNKNIKSRQALDAAANKLKKELKDYRIKDFIIKIKKQGYMVSNKWVKPNSVNKNEEKFLKIIKRFLPAFNCDGQGKNSKEI